MINAVKCLTGVNFVQFGTGCILRKGIGDNFSLPRHPFHHQQESGIGFFAVEGGLASLARTIANDKSDQRQKTIFQKINIKTMEKKIVFFCSDPISRSRNNFFDLNPIKNNYKYFLFSHTKFTKEDQVIGQLSHTYLYQFRRKPTSLCAVTNPQ